MHSNWLYPQEKRVFNIKNIILTSNFYVFFFRFHAENKGGFLLLKRYYFVTHATDNPIQIDSNHGSEKQPAQVSQIFFANQLPISDFCTEERKAGFCLSERYYFEFPYILIWKKYEHKKSHSCSGAYCLSAGCRFCNGRYIPHLLAAMD